MRKYKEKIMGGVFFTAALTSILAVLLICVFLFANGIPAKSSVAGLRILYKGFGQYLDINIDVRIPLWYQSMIRPKRLARLAPLPWPRCFRFT